MIQQYTIACAVIIITKKKFDKNFKNLFVNTYQLSSHDFNKFIVLFQKGVYPYEYIHDWGKINERPLLEKYDFQSHLNTLLMQIKRTAQIHQHRYIKRVTIEARKNYLLSEENYHTKKSSRKIISFKI